MSANPNLSTLKRILKWTLVGICGLLVFLSLLAFASVFFPFHLGSFLEFLIGKYFAAINPLTMMIVSKIAIDVWIARALAFTFLFVLPPFLLAEWLIKLLRPISLLRRRGRILIILFFWIICVSMSFLSKNVFFSQDGKPQKKYYKYTNSQIEFFPLEMSTHPVYGEPLTLVTPEIMREAELGKLGFCAVTVESLPPNADVYLNWKYKGKTPLKMTEPKTEGVLVVSLNGYVPEYKEISIEKNEILSLNLRPEEKRSKIFLTVQVDNSINLDINGFLRSELLKHKVSVTGVIEEQEFKRQSETAGGITNEAIIAWARAKFGIHYVILTSAKVAVTELEKVDVGYEKIQHSVQEMVRNELTLDLEILDLKTGRSVLAFTSKTEETVDKAMANISSLLQQACSHAARKIAQEFQ